MYGTTRRESKMKLDTKVKIATSVIIDALQNFNKPAVVWSAGKDSTVVLHLVKSFVEREGITMPLCLFIDHGDHYPETMKMLNEVANEWGLKTIVARNDNVISSVKNGMIKLSDLDDENIKAARSIGFNDEKFPYSLDSEIGNHLLKTLAMNKAVKYYRFDALFTGVRWDENAARSAEVFISYRKEPEHYRIQPILTFTERDIWDYTFSNKLPVHPLYSKGFRSIDGMHDSKKTSDKPAWEQDLENTSERAGRSQDKEGMMEKLRMFGYM